jgi:hypothetical protein
MDDFNERMLDYLRTTRSYWRAKARKRTKQSKGTTTRYIGLIKINWQTITLLFLIIISIITAVISIGMYASSFKANGISDKPTDWGVFGDFVGGTINPLLSIINICVTIRIAMIINNFSKRLAVTQIKNDGLKEFRTQLNTDFRDWEADQNSVAKIDKCINTLIEFSEAHHKLFNLKDNYTYGDLITKLSECKTQIEKGDQGGIGLKCVRAKITKGILFMDLGDDIIN